jgi:hypothetical protein
MDANPEHRSNGHAFDPLVEKLQKMGALKLPAAPKLLFGPARLDGLTLRVRVCQAIRDAGSIPPDAGCYLVATALNYLVEYRIYEGSAARPFRRLSGRMRDIQRAHGGEMWAPGEGTPEWEALSRRLNRLIDRLTTNTYREFGEGDLADLYERDPGELERRCAEGERFLAADGSLKP